MFAYVKRHRIGWLLLAVLLAGLATQVIPASPASTNAANAPHDSNAWPQAAPTPTPAWGPIITAAPTETGTAIAPQADQPTPPPTNTPVPAPVESPTPTVQGTPLPTYNASLMGIQINPDMTEQDFDTMLWLAGRLGVKWIKLQFSWKLLEPQQGTFSQTFYTYRLFVQRANQQGFDVMISIAKAPDWARASTDEDGPPQNPQDLASFITRMMGEVRVDLYGNSYFDAIEVWNEPNLRREWNGAQLGGASYMPLFDAAYNGVRAGEGGASVTVVTAGLAPTGIDDGTTAIDDREYLREMYQAGLNNPAYQKIAIGVHPYGAANPPDARWCGQDSCGGPGYDGHPSWYFLNTLEDYQTIMTDNGDTSRQLWATEFGWGTYEGFTTSDGQPAPPPADPPYFQWITQEQQANYIMRAFEIGQSLPYVGVMILWNLNYSNQELIDAQDPRAAYALLRGGEDPLRPAFKLLEAAPKQ